jgi:hypothetical protein
MFHNEKGLMGIQGVYFKRWLPGLASDDSHWLNWKTKHPLKYSWRFVNRKIPC